MENRTHQPLAHKISVGDRVRVSYCGDSAVEGIVMSVNTSCGGFISLHSSWLTLFR